MNLVQTVTRLVQEVQMLKARVSVGINSAGQFRVTSGSLNGGIWEHNHSDVAGGGLPDFTPELTSNWNGNQDPGDLWAAVNQLASRLQNVENVIVGIPQIVYPANSMIFNGME